MMASRGKKFSDKSLRLNCWDYSTPASYFVTIKTKFRNHYFGFVLNGKMHLSEIGRVVYQYFLDIPQHFLHVSVDAFVIMPNHVHGIIIIDHYTETDVKLLAADDEIIENTTASAYDKKKENDIVAAKDKKNENTVITADDKLKENTVITADDKIVGAQNFVRPQESSFISDNHKNPAKTTIRDHNRKESSFISDNHKNPAKTIIKDQNRKESSFISDNHKNPAKTTIRDHDRKESSFISDSHKNPAKTTIKDQNKIISTVEKVQYIKNISILHNYIKSEKSEIIYYLNDYEIIRCSFYKKDLTKIHFPGKYIFSERSMNKRGPQSKNLASIIRGYKAGVSKYARMHNISFEWQTLYYDMIIRDAEMFRRICRYILQNPLKWKGN